MTSSEFVLSPLRCRRGSGARQLTWLSLALLLESSACSPHPELAYTANVLEWTRGAGRRARDGAPANAFLLLLPSGSTALSAGMQLTECLSVNSMLPDPHSGEEARVYLVIDGALWVLSPQREPELVEIDGLPPGLVVVHALGFEQGSGGARLLIAGTSEAPRLLEFWLLQVHDEHIDESWPVEVEQIGRDKAAFFSRFELPRCAEHDASCLIVSNDELGAYVDLETRRSGERVAFMEFEHVQLYDAAWARPGVDAVYLLVEDCSTLGQ